jgi:hypothetical protein
LGNGARSSLAGCKKSKKSHSAYKTYKKEENFTQTIYQRQDTFTKRAQKRSKRQDVYLKTIQSILTGGEVTRLLQKVICRINSSVGASLVTSLQLENKAELG